MDYFRSKYTKHIVRNTKMLNKTKQLERLYNIYLKYPTEENKQLWFKIMKGSD